MCAAIRYRKEQQSKQAGGEDHSGWHSTQGSKPFLNSDLLSPPSGLGKSRSDYLRLMRYSPIPADLFKENRARFIAEMVPNSVAIFPANEVLTANADQPYPAQRNSDVLWLTGITQEHTMVVLYPDNPDPKMREALVILRPNEKLEKWEGHKLTADEAKAISGMEKVVFADALDAQLQVMMHHADRVYINTNENDRLDPSLYRSDLRWLRGLQRRYPLHRYERAAPLMKRLRAIKTEAEVTILREAIGITHSALERVLRFVKPGVMEYEIEAEITHEFIRRRATRHAYTPIIASGDRARVLHYIENNLECKAGELLLMDFGSEYGNYAADLTRTIPVSGTFTKRQREVYDACLQVHRYAASILKPGVSIVDYTDLVNDEMSKQCLKLGLISQEDVKNENRDDLDSRPHRKFLYHGISHHLGLDVHDIGTRVLPIEAGMVFTIEPGIYIEEEKMGIRIENNFWVTESGNVDLMKDLPITAEEIEAAMRG